MAVFNREIILHYQPEQDVCAVLEGRIELGQEVRWLDKNTVVPVVEGDEVDGWLTSIEPYTVGGKPFGSMRPVDSVKFVRKMKAFGVKFNWW